MKLKKIALMVATLAVSSSALAHGYIEFPESRAFKCKLNKNSECGSVQWEPQSVEQKSGFPNAPTPPDGKLASGGIASFSPLDVQNENRWAKNTIRAGKNQFKWFHTAPHKTNNWRYYITKSNWEPNKPLTRESFEAKPFCQVEGHGAAPPKSMTHDCIVPERSGYHVIYGVWEINDTVNSFYQVVDVNFAGGEVVDEWGTQLAGAFPERNLSQGDKVIVRFFDDSGEVRDKEIELTIADDQKGNQTQWVYDLAEKINAVHSDIRVGVKNKEGKITPEHNVANKMYVKKGSKLKSFELKYEISEVTERANVSGLQVTEIKDGNANVKFNVNVSGSVTFEARVRDNSGTELAYIREDIADANKKFSIDLKNVKPGCHWLSYTVVNKDKKSVAQDTLHLKLTSSEHGNAGDYEFTFPEGLKSYKAGTKVLQPKDNKVYECKAFPFSGYCVQWSKGATHFEPGVGSNWQDAWVLKNNLK